MPARRRPLKVAFRLAAGVAAIALGLQACVDSVTQVGEADVVELRVTPGEGSLGIGRTLQVRALPLDATSALVAGVEVTWTSSDPAVATIDGSGLASGLADGVVEFTASIAGLTATSTVTVAPPPSIALSPSSAQFSAVAGSTDERVDTVSVTNGGSFTLEGLSIDSVVYEAGPQADWLTAELLGSVAPAPLALEATLTGMNTAAEYSATVWVAGLDADNSPAPLTVNLVIQPGDAAALAVNDGDDQSGVVGATLAVAPSVRVEDAFGNAVAGEQVTFAVASGGGSITGGVATSDSAGVARVGSWTLGTTAGENTLTATLAGATPLVMIATGGAGDAAGLELAAGDGQSATAGAAVTVAPAVRVRDAFGNLVEGASVSFAPVLGGGAVTGSPAPSEADGVAEVGSWTLGPVAGPNELVATAIGVSDTIRFTATGVAGAAAVLSVVASSDAQVDTIGATLTAPLAVKVADANGNGVSGVTVAWSVTAGGGTVTDLSSSGSDGVATATRTLGTSAGDQTVSATVSGLSGSPVTLTSTALAGAPVSAVAFDGDGQSAPVGGSVSTAPAVLVSDRAGNPVPDVQVDFSPSSGGGSVSGASQITDASGVARVGSWTLGDTFGTNELTASPSGVTPVVFTATATAGAAVALQISAGDQQSALTGSAVPTPPSVMAVDAFGNGVDGVEVVFTVLSGGGSVTGASVVTSGGGVAAVGSWTLGSVAGSNTLRASATSIPASVDFTATAIGDAAAISLVAGDAQTDTVGATLPTAYAVRVVDAANNPVAGVPVSWSVTGGGGSITNSSLTGPDGVATATRVLGTAAGSQTSEASVGGLASVAFTASADPGAPALASVDGGDGQSATVGTAVPTPPSVSVTDQFGNAIGGLEVTFSVTGGGGAVTGESQVTDGGGIATVGSWTLGIQAGPNSLSATPTGLAPVPFTATGTAGAAAQLQVSAGDGQSAAAGSPVATSPAVLVTDANGNPVEGETVTFAVTSGGGSITGESPSSGSDGVATLGSWTLGPTAGANTLSASVGGLTPVVFNATGVAGGASAISLAGGNSQTDTVAATLSPYSVFVEDANGNPVAGVLVTWARSGGGSITASSNTDVNGIATATRVLGTVAGNQTATASVGGLTGSPVGFSATANAGNPTQMSISTGNGQSATVNTAVSTDPAVLIQDQFDNPVAGEPVAFSVTGGGGSVNPASPSSVVSGSNGIAAVTSWTLGTVAGTSNNTLSATATSGSVSPSSVVFTASASAGSPASIARFSGNNQTAITGTNVPNQPTVTVRDAFSNVVPSVTVLFSASGSGSANASGSTDGNGRASTPWSVNVAGSTLEGDGTYPNTLTATVQGTGIQIQFSGDAVYSFTTHVNPAWAAEGCIGCHIGEFPSAGLRLDLAASTNRAALVNVAEGSVCTGANGFVRVSPFNETASLLLQFAGVGLSFGGVAFSPPGDCFHSTKLDDGSNTEIVRAWILNGAPNN